MSDLIKSGYPIIKLVWFSDVPDDPWITAVNGELSHGGVTVMEEQLAVDVKEGCWGLDSGFGEYLFQTSYFDEETEFCHGAPRVTIKAHWEFNLLEFKPEIGIGEENE